MYTGTRRLLHNAKDKLDEQIGGNGVHQSESWSDEKATIRAHRAMTAGSKRETYFTT